MNQQIEFNLKIAWLEASHSLKISDMELELSRKDREISMLKREVNDQINNNEMLVRHRESEIRRLRNSVARKDCRIFSYLTAIFILAISLAIMIIT